MTDSRLLSTHHETSPSQPLMGGDSVFVAASVQHHTSPHIDPCQASVMLRAILTVQSVLAVVLLFSQPTGLDWLLQYAVLTVGTLPATLMWLFLCCTGLRWLSLKHISRPRHQAAFAVTVGIVCGWLACASLKTLALINQAPWLASALSGGMLAGALTGLLLWRHKALQPSESQGRLKELQARIRPHFLFNTLNSAIALVRAEPAKAESLLEDLSELFRAAMQDTPAGSTVAQELALAERYLAIEQIRFGSRLRIRWQLDPQAESAKLPALILQPLVENAVHHGVEPSHTGADLTISTRRSASRVVIKITNTVPQRAQSNGHGLALPNVRERLKLMHDLDCSFRHELTDGVFRVRLEVPA